MKLTLKNIGPVKSCDLNVGSFHVITGKQSSGKSTIAKCLYLFLSLKDELFNLVYEKRHPGYSEDYSKESITTVFKSKVIEKLNEIFGSNGNPINNHMSLRMDYTDDFYIKILNDGFLKCSFSNNFRDFLKQLDHSEIDYANQKDLILLKKKIEDFFHIDYSPVYIPAGRSIMTTLGNQFSFIYYKLDDYNKELIDLCTRDYFDIVMKLKPRFANGLKNISDRGSKDENIIELYSLINKVIGGEYYYYNGKEFMLLNNGKMIDVNMASSGQQESLWIYNILLFYTIIKEKKFFIIEEPESNLFPESQKYIMRFIGYVANAGNMMLINTHSPYVLGELNNMIYAGSFTGNKKKKANEIINDKYQLKFKNVQALFVEDGNVIDIMDNDIQQIDNSKLDQISSVINEDYNRLLEIEGN